MVAKAAMIHIRAGKIPTIRQINPNMQIQKLTIPITNILHVYPQVISQLLRIASIAFSFLSMTRKGTNASLQAKIIPGTISIRIPRLIMRPNRRLARMTFQEVLLHNLPPMAK
jgi:hypothetical protein